QIIILIVYLPILSLSGIEGKMFKPMAQTVAFAILGAFILSLTYVPMISALAISKKITQRPTLSDRVMARIENLYLHLLQKALRVRKLLVAATVALFAVTVFLFTRMGGEFIPQLEEGDFAVETRLLVGANLSTTISSISRISEALKARYPEVEQVVSRIGSAEIPTDPMPIEGGDMIIVLKDKSQWTSAKTFTELAGKMSATVQDVMPGVTTGFQYPVQMRFNELMTGAKQDVVCKIFGEDLDKLAAYAAQLGDVAKKVKGTADWYIESVTGMPQIVIDYNRDLVAQYGMDIENINKTVNAAFAGATAGKIYEGEKSFDLVVRVGGEGRRSIEDVRNLLVSAPSGLQIPLYQLATISEVEGPNQIQRENARRRIIVGFNVRGRDVQSIVEELQQKAAAQLKLAPGYSITYGGTFENLQEARKRLMVAVPVALLLIFGLLYFVFSSLKEGALIFTAIPLSAIGGVCALWIRGMPFSISAGVGFIALFGVAVLNGIVLISEFNRIKKEGSIPGITELVMAGTRNRLRPVLMTAAVASLGFLPMAISNGAGAEVQRPLATVVIGGLVTATFLTLFVLPALYLLSGSKRKGAGAKAAATLLLLGTLQTAGAQSLAYRPVGIEEALIIAGNNNNSLAAVRLQARAAGQLKATAFDPAKAQLTADYGQVNSAYHDNRIGLSQSLAFPTVYTRQAQLLKAQAQTALETVNLNELELKAAVRTLFYDYAVLARRKELLHYADSLYGMFAARSAKRFAAGAANILEKTAAEMQRAQISNQLILLEKDLEITLNQFNALLQDTVPCLPRTAHAKYIIPDAPADLSALPDYRQAASLTQAAFRQWKLEQARKLPDLFAGYSNQSLSGVQTIRGQDRTFGTADRFSYISAGISVPLFFRAQAARARAAKLAWQSRIKETDETARQLETRYRNAGLEVTRYGSVLEYYEKSGLGSAADIIAAADEQFKAGETDYLQWVILINQAISLRSEYLNTLGNFNRAAIQFTRLKNK
ncbi:MAG: CusA/CzcA family heavy metal efflux RND transporter, partial [Chitinophagaceae bacterium]|nr:CusA/CzcA family heavy metal efflux RND transporter [Chitinophagaceae bacterium]